jgi:hypothetical protein
MGATTDRDTPLLGVTLARRSSMRTHTIALLLAAFASCDGSSCPSSPEFFCESNQQALTCEFKLEGGPVSCRCDGRVWTCNDCPDLAPPIGACSGGQTCSVWGFENECACACESGEWSCVVSDPSPNFHCSP